MAIFLHLFKSVSDFTEAYEGEDYKEPWVSYVDKAEEERVDYNKRPEPCYVDLGLPSGTLWGCMNIGAEDEYDFGNMYAWGELETKAEYTKANYKFFDAVTSGFTKYNETDEKADLELEDDVANVMFGGEWHIPTMEQWGELIDNTTCTIDRVNNCVVFTAGNGNSVKFPVTRDWAQNYEPGIQGDQGIETNICWLSHLSFGYPYDEAFQIYSNCEGYFGPMEEKRYMPCSVRPVKGAGPSDTTGIGDVTWNS